MRDYFNVSTPPSIAPEVAGLVFQRSLGSFETTIVISLVFYRAVDQSATMQNQDDEDGPWWIRVREAAKRRRDDETPIEEAEEAEEPLRKKRRMIIKSARRIDGRTFHVNKVDGIKT